ncbi:DUF4023 domain-containing protein [Paenibacillus sambharensis]|uniref:DUF4023 domain-containing protein n=1 Tax=Paenibacillus sambharensis TaxID=1803190 RepID=A0A2W1L9Z9_9BACL|nr:DUF4023 domain-containing protein [Paenibacillus sambharensis]PZD96066.1 DUF4023 domain-containing protein [Paenibacillus sambharensis]
MEDTRDFVNKVKDTQAKDLKNRKTQGKGTPSEKLPNKLHSNNP